MSTEEKLRAAEMREHRLRALLGLALERMEEHTLMMGGADLFELEGERGLGASIRKALEEKP